MLADQDLLEYVQQVQTNRSTSSSLVPGLTQRLSTFLTHRCGSVENFLAGTRGHLESSGGIDGFARLKKLRRALAALDRGGWERSYHQRLFHEHFITSIVRVLFKTDPPGAFQRAYPRILEVNNWSETYQECLISTPRRFGKTMSVCLFVAALLYTAPNIEISIYSTCKRISQKLLRNCLRFLDLIFEVQREKPLEFSRKSMDEVEIIGDESQHDYRKLNSYPSKVPGSPARARAKSLRAPARNVCARPRETSARARAKRLRAPLGASRGSPARKSARPRETSACAARGLTGQPCAKVRAPARKVCPAPASLTFTQANRQYVLVWCGNHRTCIFNRHTAPLCKFGRQCGESTLEAGVQA